MTKTLMTNLTLFDGEHDTNLEHAFLGFDDQDGRIIESGTGTPTASYDEQIDLQGQYIMPGMINAHTHITSAPTHLKVTGNYSDAVWATKFGLDNMHDMLANGITTIRVVGTADDLDLKLEAMRQQGLAEGPKMITSGSAFTMTGGHFYITAHEVDSPDEMRKGVRQLLKKGATNIKFMATGGVSFNGETPNDIQLSEEEMRAGTIEAHHKGIPVAAHAQGNAGIKNAIRAGVDSIEHGFYLDDEAIQMMLDRGTFLTPTLNAMWAIINRGKDDLPDWMLKKANGHWLAHKKSIEMAAKAGIPIAMGTDAGTPYNDFKNDSAWELELMMTQSHMTSLQALQSTTINAAKLLRIDSDYGTLSAGKFADFLILPSDPLADIKTLQGAKRIFQNGKECYSAQPLLTASKATII